MPYRTGFPLPDVEHFDTRDWWTRVRQHQLTVQRCTGCRAFRHPPSPVCHRCHSFEFEWSPVSGKGTVYSWIIANHPPSPALKEQVPYNVVVVELDDADGIRMMGNLIDVPDSQIHIGLPVEVVFEDINDQVTLPQWRKAG